MLLHVIIIFMVELAVAVFAVRLFGQTKLIFIERKQNPCTVNKRPPNINITSINKANRKEINMDIKKGYGN